MKKVLSRPSSKLKMTDFSLAVLKFVKMIPRGKVASYGQIAALAGKPHGARGVGWILNSSAEAYNLPWQRVLNSKGKISFPTKSEEFKLQKLMLLEEGVKFSDDDSVDLKKFGWKKSPPKKRASPNRPTLFS